MDIYAQTVARALADLILKDSKAQGKVQADGDFSLVKVTTVVTEAPAFQITVTTPIDRRSYYVVVIPTDKDKP